ncbi:carbonic anhydrase [Spirochaeta thermophila]|uniref:Carbonic anhydrase n=1 Tax=Winmispira thermophila (strain ATCC 49972 / DSM 6192 / RI 19.B1) TaxID=665571 RepID=E0RNK5_WINT6|nr:carbonic anhydrase [Spirochaeta thermophila]ADN02596.1 hypothetical protein STHERM_c16580 [Spirochaeta thermophila DSM 6192]
MSQWICLLTCMDGRIQRPVLEFLLERHPGAFIDTITEPGMDGLLATHRLEEIPGLLRKLEISFEVHGARAVYVAGHTDCAGNPVDDAVHLAHIRRGIHLLTEHFPGIPVRGLWVGPTWKVASVEA